MRSSHSRLWKWACMIKWYRAIHLFGLTANEPCQNAAFGTRRRLKGNATKHTQAMGDGKIVCEPRATTDICFMQWWWLSSRLSGGGGKEGAEGGRGSLSVRRREQPGLQIATIRDTKEGNASDTMHAFSGIVGCQCREGAMSILLTGPPGSGASSQPLVARFVERAYAAGPFSSHTRAMCGVSV